MVFICKQTCAADTDNGYVANGQTLSFDNKAPAKGDVFAAIAKSVFLGLASAKKNEELKEPTLHASGKDSKRAQCQRELSLGTRVELL